MKENIFIFVFSDIVIESKILVNPVGLDAVTLSEILILSLTDTTGSEIIDETDSLIVIESKTERND